MILVRWRFLPRVTEFVLEYLIVQRAKDLHVGLRIENRPALGRSLIPDKWNGTEGGSNVISKRPRVSIESGVQ